MEKGKIIGDAKADYREPGITDGNSTEIHLVTKDVS